MIKKIFIACGLFLSSVSIASASTSYLGAGLGLQNAGGFNGIIGNVFGGYGVTVNQNKYLGGEIFADIGSIPLSKNQHNRSTFGIGASFIPGILFNPYSMAYARIGVETSRIHGSGNGVQFRTGGQLGLGVETKLTGNWDIRGEYIYTGSGIINNFTTARNNRMNVGFLYKFD